MPCIILLHYILEGNHQPHVFKNLVCTSQTKMCAYKANDDVYLKVINACVTII